MYFSQVSVKQLAIILVMTASTIMLSLSNRAHANDAKPRIGEDIFRNRCTICHGLDGSGHTTLGKKLGVPDLRSDEVQKQSDDELLEIIATGQGDMPAFKKKLSRDSIYQVTIHLRKLRDS
jgi:mono/diheme cytochrome c family protein